MKRMLLSAMLSSALVLSGVLSANAAQEVRGLALKDTHLWCATSTGVVNLDLQSMQCTRYSVRDGLGSDDITAVATFFDGTVLAGAGCRVYRCDAASGRWEEIPAGEGLPGEVTSILIHPDCMYCVATEDGVCRYTQNSWGLYTTKSGLADNQVRQLVSQPDGTVWFATAGGVSRYHNDFWVSYTTADGLPSNDVGAIAAGNDGVIWAGTTSGVSRFDGKSWQSFTTADGLSDNRILSLVAAPDRSVWAGTASGISHYTGESWTPVGGPGAPEGAAGALALDSDGVLWVGTEAGLFRFDGLAWKTVDLALQPTSVKASESLPVALSIAGNYPNPFNPGTVIEFTLPSATRAEIAVYSATGQKVKTLHAGTLPAGRRSVAWDGRDESGQAAASGMYMAVVRTEKTRAAHRMLLVR